MTLTIDHDILTQLAGRHRRELLAHCYRMLGSVHDAEDALQETLLRAWQGRAGYEGRATPRVWLYRIATNACLRLLERRARLPLPAGLGAPETDPRAPVAGPPAGRAGSRSAAPRLDSASESAPPAGSAGGSVPAAPSEARWLEPLPTDRLTAADDDPAAVAVARESVRLAFVSALQHLPARQRAALVLRDVLVFSAQETADILDTTPAAVNSALQRARAHLAEVAPEPGAAAEPAEPERRRTLDRFVRAFETADVPLLVDLFRADIVLEMPPMPAWFQGAESVLAFLAAQVLTRPDRFRLRPVRANGQDGFAAYLADGDGTGTGTGTGTNGFHPHGISVLTLAADARISHAAFFLDPGLFPAFGLPATPDGAPR